MGFSSYCYTLHRQEVTWMEAEIYCQTQHLGHLTSVLSGTEASFVATMIKTSGIRKPYIWIGLHDPTEGQQPNRGGWRWINNDVLHYHAWEANPPPCAYNGYCATVSENTGYQQWKDYACNQKLPFVCRFKA
ncbi:lithostathine-like [Talpa occidentalis]|uniref:lithostathine-like n=1 Tax=Talpa occidentalis TaxID=50954 RepID=UPI0023F7FAAB|nr:lithostathine-like [Talpa occidentalis]